MKLLEFIFSFLYVRDWYTGRMELSRPRLALFSGMVLIVVIGLAIAFFLQSPVTYSRGG